MSRQHLDHTSTLVSTRSLVTCTTVTHSPSYCSMYSSVRLIYHVHSHPRESLVEVKCPNTWHYRLKSAWRSSSSSSLGHWSRTIVIWPQTDRAIKRWDLIGQRLSLVCVRTPYVRINRRYSWCILALWSKENKSPLLSRVHHITKANSNRGALLDQ